jgi:hypothetical protein
MLLALILLACAPPEDTGNARVGIASETDSIQGTYHLSRTLDPDPAIVGSQTVIIALTRNVDSAALDGALVAGATLIGTLTAPESSTTGSIQATFDEEPSGTYTGSWTWSTAGYWELSVSIGDQVEDDEATFAFLVEAAG